MGIPPRIGWQSAARPRLRAPGAANLRVAERSLRILDGSNGQLETDVRREVLRIVEGAAVERLGAVAIDFRIEDFLERVRELTRG
jgi:hypothetical protein